MIALAYYSPPTRQPNDGAEAAHREGAAGPFLTRDASAPSPIAPGPQTVERHGTDDVPAQASSVPSIEMRPNRDDHLCALTKDEMRAALAFLRGWEPDAYRVVVDCATGLRP